MKERDPIKIEIDLNAETNQTFGNRIEEVRQSKGMSLRAVAEKSGKDHSTISRLEKGNRTPDLSTAIQIVQSFSLDLLERLSIYEGKPVSEILVELDNLINSPAYLTHKNVTGAKVISRIQASPIDGSRIKITKVG